VTEKISYAPVIEVGGKPMAAEQYDELRTVRVDRRLGLVGRATLRFSDMGYGLASTTIFKIGTKLKVKQFPSTELFSGTVVGVTLEQMQGEEPYLVVVADDAAYKLSRGSKTTTHLKTSYTSAVKSIVSKAGLKTKVESSPGTKEYLLQAGSDLEFIDTIAARTGYSWWVDQDTFHFAPAGTATGRTKLTLNEDLHEFSVRASALRPTEVTIGGWSTDNQQKVVAKTDKASVWTSPPDFVKPYVNDAKTIGAAPTGSGELSPLDQNEAMDAAQAQFDESMSAALIARGRGEVNGAIKPSVMVQVDHAGPASGQYYVTEVQHVYDPRGFHTRFVAGPLRPAGLVDTLGVPAIDPGFAIQGLVVGVVTNNNDPTKNGRVKVRYAGVPDNVESDWARVLTTSGGKNRGLVFLPEVDDEVLVGFEGNDTRRPVILGSLFSKQNALPEAGKLLGQGNKVDYRRITSRLGHIIELADGTSPATQHVLVKLGTAEHSLRLGGDNFTLEVASGKPVTIKAGTAKFEISAAGDITIEGGNINIKATKALNLEGPRTTVKGNSQVQVQGGQVQVKGMGTTAVEAGGPLTIKGITVAIN
jgi:phage baseplate assembly protein gpV/phage protein D